MAEENGGSQPCAICRHRRKRCDANCEFAPLFPGNKYEEFQNALKLYSMRRLESLIRSVEPEQQKTCAESIIEESNAWRNHDNPGVLAISRKIQSQIDYALWELQIVKHKLTFYKGTKMDKVDNSVNVSSSACDIAPQSGQLHDFNFQKPWSNEMMLSCQLGKYRGEESRSRENVQNLNNQGESSSVSKSGDKGKRIADE